MPSSSSRKAKPLAMEELHNLTALQLTQVIKQGVPLVRDGEPVVDEFTGEIVRVPASAAYFAAAIKFLKDNDITADLAPNSPMAGLVGSLPTFLSDDGDTAMASEDLPSPPQRPN